MNRILKKYLKLNSSKNIFDNIKEELSKKEESKSDEFINQLIKYFKIKNEKTKKDFKYDN
jgi:hypothetical protein